jgi:DNA transformation protein
MVPMGKPGGHLEDLRSIGPRSASWLRAAGIADADRLRALGAVEAYRRVRGAEAERASLTLLWALHGALIDAPYTALPPEIKAQLKAELASA